MPWTAVALVLLAALLHAGWNIVAKQSGGGAPFALAVALAITLIWAPLGLVLAWRDVGAYGAREWVLLGASAVLHVAYISVLLAGYRRADLTVVYPVARGSGPLVTALLSTAVFGERLGHMGTLGVAAIAGGVFLIAGGPALLRRTGAAGQRARVRAGLRWGAATGLLIASYTVVDGYAVKVALMSPILVDYLCNVLRVPLLLPLALADKAGFARELRAQWKRALLVALVSPVAYVLVLYAATLAPLSRVAPAREVSMLFAALLGGHLLGERDRGVRLAGAACIALGVALLARP